MAKWCQRFPWRCLWCRFGRSLWHSLRHGFRRCLCGRFCLGRARAHLGGDFNGMRKILWLQISQMCQIYPDFLVSLDTGKALWNWRGWQDFRLAEWIASSAVKHWATRKMLTYFRTPCQYRFWIPSTTCTRRFAANPSACQLVTCCVSTCKTVSEAGPVQVWRAFHGTQPLHTFAFQARKLNVWHSRQK